MSDLITRTARLVPYAKRPKQVPSFVTAYSYEPLANDPGAKFGSLYVVMEVLVSGRASEEVADLIIETIGEQYYNHPDTSTEPLTRFEAAVKATNQELSEHVNRGNAAWIGKLSSVVAVQIGSELHIAQTGSAEAFLYRGKATSHITPQSTNRPATPAKTFGSIASGQMEAGDRLLLATPALIHQVSLTRLQGVITNTSPNSAIAEITNLLHDASTERIAALIIEITTPELAALQVRSEEPNEIQLGVPENAIQAARMVAAPLAQTTVASSKKFVSIAHTSLRRAKPHVRAIGLSAAERIRKVLGTTAGRKAALIGIAVALVAITSFLIYQRDVSNNARTTSAYQHVYQDFQRAEHLLGTGAKTGARETLQGIQHQLGDFKPRERVINKYLQKAALSEGEPRTLAALSSLVADRIDQIDGLVKADPVTIASFTAKNARPDQFQLSGNNAYILDSANNTLWIVDVTTGSMKSSAIDTSRLGAVVNTTISSNNDGLYILTAKPSVWFYRFDTDTITEQNIAYSQWPKATSIASYGTNLYLLGDTAVYKHVKNATGFSPKSDHLVLASYQETKNSTALAVDGSILLLSPTGLHRYLGGVLKQSAPAPDTLIDTYDLRIAAGGNAITASNPKSRRIGLWTLKGDNLIFNKQISANNIKALYGATYDPKSGNVYALVDGRLVRFTVSP